MKSSYVWYELALYLLQRLVAYCCQSDVEGTIKPRLLVGALWLLLLPPRGGVGRRTLCNRYQAGIKLRVLPEKAKFFADFIFISANVTVGPINCGSSVIIVANQTFRWVVVLLPQRPGIIRQLWTLSRPIFCLPLFPLCLFHCCLVPFCLPKKVPKKGPRFLLPPRNGIRPDWAFVLL